VWPFRQQGSPLPYWSEQLCRDCRWSHLLSVVIQWGWRWWGKRRRIGTMVSKVFCWCCSLRTTRLTSAPRTMWDGWLHIWRWIIIHISSLPFFLSLCLSYVEKSCLANLPLIQCALFGKKTMYMIKVETQKGLILTFIWINFHFASCCGVSMLVCW
jgi:hypothetical protein